MSNVKKTIGALSRLAMAAAVGVALAGCNVHGVQMVNKTGRTLNVEYLHLNKDGSLSGPYSRAILPAEGQLKHHPPIEGGYVGERVRVAVADSPDVEGHSILLHVPEKKTRDFDIEYTAGRLFIREYKKGRDWSKTGEPDWGE